MTQTTRSNHSVLRASRSALAGATLLALALGQGCALDPDDPEADGVSPQLLEAGGVGQGFLFGGAAGSVDDQRSDLTAAGVPAAVAAHTSFDGFAGNVDSANRIGDLVDRVSADAKLGVSANIALHAPGDGGAQSFTDWGTRATADAAWRHQLDALASALGRIKQRDGSPQPVYVRYAKEFNQQYDAATDSCIGWLADAAAFHRRQGAHTCADELFWQWTQVHDAFAAAPNVKLVWCPTGQLTPTAAIRNPAAANTDELWPGSGKVDVIGPDAYNGKRPDNVTPAGAFGDFVRLAQAAHRSFLISETGVVKDFGKPALVDKNWYADLYTYLTGVERDDHVDVIGVAGFWRATSFGDTRLDATEGRQLAAHPGFLRP